jgi:succinate dehydrogenase/fumarate reductase cytochrome b subunit (b558 family)
VTAPVALKAPNGEVLKQKDELILAKGDKVTPESIRLMKQAGIEEIQASNLYEIVREHFKMWWYAGLYVVAMILLGLHLNHGFQSAFRTLGANHPKYLPIIKGVGTAIAVLVPAGFASFPIYFFLTSL